jgi:large subunit ribosomal protein L22
MTTYRYSTNTDRKGIAKAVGINLAISRKKSIEVCNQLRKRDVGFAIRMLERVIAQKQAIPMRRFNKDTGHKPGIGPGRYPIKTCIELLALVKRAQAAAEQQGLDPKSLSICHISAQQAGSQMHYGRQRRRLMKRAHVELVVEEKKEHKREQKEKKEQAKREHAKTEEAKTESKKTEQKKTSKKTEGKTENKTEHKMDNKTEDKSGDTK